MSGVSPENWMQVRDEGLYCKPADIFIDPHASVPNAIITHGHADHARAGHGHVTATTETLAIMETRYGGDSISGGTALSLGERITLSNDVALWLAPAGHVLGSAQAVLEYGGQRVVISGDYKRHQDPTCLPFEVVPCDVFVTEATFALPVFAHPPVEHEMAKLTRSMESLSDRTHLVGVYGLGKCQRVMASLRQAGYEHPFYLHGALVKLTELYERFGQDFGDWQQVAAIDKSDREQFRGRIVLCPPSALTDRWSRSLPDPLPIMASGWMQIRARARAKTRRTGPDRFRSCRLERPDPHLRGHWCERCLDNPWPGRGP